MGKLTGPIRFRKTYLSEEVDPYWREFIYSKGWDKGIPDNSYTYYIDGIIAIKYNDSFGKAGQVLFPESAFIPTCKFSTKFFMGDLHGEA